MSSFITLIHVVVAIILMISVLLQTGKGSGLGAAFGGSSSSVFGARGPATFISRVTTVAAIIFMVTSLTLSVFAEGAYKRGSVIEADPEPASVAAPVEGRAVSEEEAQVPVDPALLPAPGEGATEAVSDTPNETTQVPSDATGTPTETAAPAAGDAASASSGAAREPGVSASPEEGDSSASETGAVQSASDQSPSEEAATGESEPDGPKPGQ
jgi:preprotein translocase subunit SecG